jgi:UDP-glucose 4-epimerase
MNTNKIFLITGGTGSFGNAVLDRLLKSDVREVRIFSRDEKKQDDMRKKFNNTKLKFYLGDVRDEGSLKTAMRGLIMYFMLQHLSKFLPVSFFPYKPFLLMS